MKKYEALFILSNNIADDELETKIEQIKAEIAKSGGSAISATRMGRMSFARPLAKKEAGVYVQVVLQIDPGKIPSLRDRYRHNEDIIRMLIVAAKSIAAAPVSTGKDKEKEK